jgi:hypothetical protein
MKAELEDSLGTIPLTQKPRTVTIKDRPLDLLLNTPLLICEISIATFQLSTHRKDYKVFTISLYEIDRLIEDTTSQEASSNSLEAEELASIT